VACGRGEIAGWGEIRDFSLCVSPADKGILNFMTSVF